DRAAVGTLAVPLQNEPEPVVPRPAVVAEQPGRAAVFGKDDVQVAVAVDVCEGAAAAHERLEQVGAGLLGPDELEAALALAARGVPEELHGLLVGLAGLDLADLGLQVAVTRQHVLPAVEVVVEEAGAELKQGPTG